jgi:lipoprotein-releasing system ATP-binding protein
LLEAKNIRRIYQHGLRQLAVLKGLELVVESGKFIAIVGPSGAGKSTLLHIIGGLDQPSAGQVIFEGEDIYGLSDLALSELRNKKVGFVFQFYHLLSEFTVLENVLIPAWINLKNGLKSKLGDKASKEIALQLLRQVGLSDRLTHFPSQLSGGEQQRVAIVRSLINQPKLLLCDEPTGNLDSRAGSEIIGLIKKINSENQTAVVLVTHNLELAKVADQIYSLRDGIIFNY